MAFLHDLSIENDRLALTGSLPGVFLFQINLECWSIGALE
jgi:hypothetical protein